MKVFNTLTKTKEEFKPIKSNHVSIYQCGPTVYWTQHIGNMRSAVFGDIVHRTFKQLGYGVEFVKNYTDVGHLTSDQDFGEDRIEKGAKREKLSPKEIVDKYIKQYERDVEDLNVLDPDYSPKATDNISEIKKMIVTLVNNKFAYETPLGIYFDTSKAKDYTRLSGQKLEENLSGEGHGDVSDKDKKNPTDFALWIYKKGTHANALQTWPSPKFSFFEFLVKRPKGFPGWHIECSAMAKKFLGETIDIHLGGIEHIPVHHTNEIAQSENANKKPFVNYWLHHEHLLIDNNKMSKSEGTAYSLADLRSKGFTPLSLRFLFLQAHYKSKQNFTWDALQSAENGLKKLKHEVNRLADLNDIKPDKNYMELFEEKLSDDFNTPQAIVVLYNVLESALSSEIKRATILEMDKVLGLNLDEKIEKEEIPEEIEELVKLRQEARENKDFFKADEIRTKIEDSGFTLKDTENGVEVEKI